MKTSMLTTLLSIKPLLNCALQNFKKYQHKKQCIERQFGIIIFAKVDRPDCTARQNPSSECVIEKSVKTLTSIVIIEYCITISFTEKSSLQVNFKEYKSQKNVKDEWIQQYPSWILWSFWNNYVFNNFLNVKSEAVKRTNVYNWCEFPQCETFL